MNDREFGIYSITNLVNGNMYIGQTLRSFKERWDAHKRELRANVHHNNCLQGAFNKYGEENLIFQVVHSCDELDNLNKLEVYYIEKYDTFKNGYNLTMGGDGEYYCNQKERLELLKQKKINLLRTKGLSEDIIIGIKKALAKETDKIFRIRCSEISKMFNVSEPTVASIRHLKSWAEIGEHLNDAVIERWSVSSKKRSAEKIYNMLINEGKTIEQIACELDLPEEKVTGALLRNKIKYGHINKANIIKQNLNILTPYIRDCEYVNISDLSLKTGINKKAVRRALLSGGYEELLRKKRPKTRVNKEKNTDIKGVSYDNASKTWFVRHYFEKKLYFIASCKELNEAARIKEECKGITSVSDLENIRAKYRKGDISKKYIDVFDSSNNYIRTIEGIGEVSRMLNIRRGSVEKVLYGQRKTTKGFIFKYASL